MLLCSNVHIGPWFHSEMWMTIPNGQVLIAFLILSSSVLLLPLSQPQMLPWMYQPGMGLLWKLPWLSTPAEIFFFYRYSHEQFFFSHGQFFHPLESLCSNHTLTITNLSQPLSWHSRTPLHQSIFSFPQNSSLSNILYNLLIYYVYCLMPTSPFKTKAPTEWGSLLRLLTYTESLQQCPAHNRHSINSYWIKLNWK